jgi:hypothetical protein
MDWDLNPGDKIVRKEMHARYGGRPQGGIGPSNQTPNVFVFTDPATGRRYGYFDGWDGEWFHYYGEGRFGDQQMTSGNAAILRHVKGGRALRLFQGARGEVTYLGEYELDPKEPFYETDAPDLDGAIRKVIVFRMRPMGDALLPAKTPVSEAPRTIVETVPVEEQYTERAFVDPSREPYEADRREARLVRNLRDSLSLRDHVVRRLKIVPEGEAKPLFADLIDETANVLVEAKGSVSRDAIRMAIGQLADYSRFRPDAARAILVPEKPRADLLTLAASVGVAVVWPTNGSFEGAPSLPW